MGLFDFFKRKPQPAGVGVTSEQAVDLMQQAFPGGEEQIARETAALSGLLNERYTRAQTAQLLQLAKALLILSEDQGSSHARARLVEIAQGRMQISLPQSDANTIIRFAAGEGHTGSTQSGGNDQSEDRIDAMVAAAFPGGELQMNRESAQLHALLAGTLTPDETLAVLSLGKLSLLSMDDKSEAAVIPYIVNFSQSKLSGEEAAIVYHFICESMAGAGEPDSASGDLWGDGDGSDPSQAVVIHATSTFEGIAVEGVWIEQKYGVRDRDWSKGRQALLADTGDGRTLETIDIKLRDGSARRIYFDITAFYGRM
jgi:hypothetical protein